MRGEIKALFLFLVGPTERLAAAESSADDSPQLVGGAIDVVVDDHVRELRLCLELALGGSEPRLDLLRVIGPPGQEPLAERLAARRRDEHRDGLGEGLANLARALDLDLEDHGGAGPEPAVD